MLNSIQKTRKSLIYRIFCGFMAFSFLFSMVPSYSYGQIAPLLTINMPKPGQIMTLSPVFTPVIVKGITINPENPLEFDFIVDSGNDNLKGEVLKAESLKLIKYFLATLTTPEKELWVNLSPAEKNRIIPDKLGTTEMGRDLLAQDYILKQLTSSLMYPENELGKKFWEQIYAKAKKEFNTTDIPVDTFNKIWITPDKAVVYEKDNSAFVLESHLKVMLENDYLASSGQGTADSKINNPTANRYTLNAQTEIIKEIILPAIEKEVNEGKNFAPLRQIYNSMILATWFKKTLKESLLGKVYVDQNKTKGIDLADKNMKEKIYSQYIEAFEKGAYSYIKEEYDPKIQQIVAKKYFSGGFEGKDLALIVESVNAQTVEPALITQASKSAGRIFNERVNFTDVGPNAEDYAMKTSPAENFVNQMEGMGYKKIAENVMTLIKDFNDSDFANYIDLQEYLNRRYFLLVEIFDEVLRNKFQGKGFVLNSKKATIEALPKFLVESYINDGRLFISQNEMLRDDVVVEIEKQIKEFLDRPETLRQTINDLFPNINLDKEWKSFAAKNKGISQEEFLERFYAFSDIYYREAFGSDAEELLLDGTTKVTTFPKEIYEKYITDSRLLLPLNPNGEQKWDYVQMREEIEQAIKNLEKESDNAMISDGIAKFANKLASTDLAYITALYEKYQIPANQKNKLEIDRNFKPSAKLNEKERKDLLGAVDYAQDIVSHSEYKQAAKNVVLLGNPMDGGLGSSFKRSTYLKRIASRDAIAAKGTDLFFEMELPGFSEKGEATTIKELVSVTELKYIRAIQEAGLYGKIILQELVNEESEPVMEAFLDQTIYLFDRLDQRKDSPKRTYRQILTETPGLEIAEKMIVQGALPVIDKNTGKLTDEFTAPGGHGQLGSMALQEALIRELPQDQVFIRAVYNGDGVNNAPDADVVGYMAKNNIPIIMISTTKTPLDMKGGLIGIEEELINRKIVIKPQMMEIAQANKVGQTVLFRAMGLTEGEKNGQFFNTNIALMNYSVLQPFLKELKSIIGEQEFNKIVTPDLIENEKDKGNGRKVTQLEGAMGSALLNLNGFVMTSDRHDVKDLMKKYNFDRLLYFVNIDPVNRTKFFTPIKYACDFWLYEKSGLFYPDINTGMLINKVAPHLPGFGEGFSEKYPYYQDVQTVLDAFGDAKVESLDFIDLIGKIHLAGAVLKGNVVVESLSDKIIDLNKIDLGLPRDNEGRLILDNVTIKFDREGKLVFVSKTFSEKQLPALDLDASKGASRVNRPVKQGTSGDRGQYGKDWTIDHQRRISQGIASYRINNGITGAMLLGYDPRQDNKQATMESARIYAANGIKTYVIIDEPTSVPALAYLINSNPEITGGEARTASHSPSTDGGTKYLTSYGGASPTQVTQAVDKEANNLVTYKTMDYQEAKELGLIVEISPEEAQDKYVDEYVIPTLKEMGAWDDIVNYVKNNPDFESVVDAMQGAGARYLKAIYAALAKDVGRDFYAVINDDNTDPNFLKVNKEPNPTKEKSRLDLVNTVKEKTAQGKIVLGASVDADADRFGNIDTNGEFISANDMIALIAYFLKKEIGLEGVIGKTVASSNFINAIADYLNVELDEEPVGFKWFVDNVYNKGRNYVVAGEESSHVAVGPFMKSWDDGAVVGLMGLWIMARTGKSLTEYKDFIQKTLDKKFKIETLTQRQEGVKETIIAKVEQANQEIFVILNGENRKLTREELASLSIVQELESKQEQKVVDVNIKDGVKLVFEDGSWVLTRPSGTEPAGKGYVEVVGNYAASNDAMEIKFKNFANILNDMVGYTGGDKAMIADKIDEDYDNVATDQAMTAQEVITIPSIQDIRKVSEIPLSSDGKGLTLQQYTLYSKKFNAGMTLTVERKGIETMYILSMFDKRAILRSQEIKNDPSLHALVEDDISNPWIEYLNLMDAYGKIKFFDHAMVSEIQDAYNAISQFKDNPQIYDLMQNRIEFFELNYLDYNKRRGFIRELEMFSQGQLAEAIEMNIKRLESLGDQDAKALWIEAKEFIGKNEKDNALITETPVFPSIKNFYSPEEGKPMANQKNYYLNLFDLDSGTKIYRLNLSYEDLNDKGEKGTLINLYHSDKLLAQFTAWGENLLSIRWDHAFQKLADEGKIRFSDETNELAQKRYLELNQAVREMNLNDQKIIEAKIDLDSPQFDPEDKGLVKTKVEILLRVAQGYVYSGNLESSHRILMESKELLPKITGLTNQEYKDLELNLEKGIFYYNEAVDISTDENLFKIEDSRVGGIDLNPELLDMQIKRDGNGVPLPLNLQPLETMHIEGFIPVIINITPVENFSMLLGVVEENDKTKKVSFNNADVGPIEALDRKIFITA